MERGFDYEILEVEEPNGDVTVAVVPLGGATLDAKKFVADYAGVRADTTIPKMLEG